NKPSSFEASGITHDLLVFMPILAGAQICPTMEKRNAAFRAPGSWRWCASRIRGRRERRGRNRSIQAGFGAYFIGNDALGRARKRSAAGARTSRVHRSPGRYGAAFPSSLNRPPPMPGGRVRENWLSAQCEQRHATLVLPRVPARVSETLVLRTYPL